MYLRKLEDLKYGFYATVDGIVPFTDPFREHYANPDGSINRDYQLSQRLGAMGRDLMVMAGGAKLTQIVFNSLAAEAGVGGWKSLSLFEKIGVRMFLMDTILTQELGTGASIVLSSGLTGVTAYSAFDFIGNLKGIDDLVRSEGKKDNE